MSLFQTYLSLLPSSYRHGTLYGFYLAQSFLSSEPKKACNIFINTAAMGIGKLLWKHHHDTSFIDCDDELYKHCRGDTDESGDPLSVYYHKVYMTV